MPQVISSSDEARAKKSASTRRARLASYRTLSEKSMQNSSSQKIHSEVSRGSDESNSLNSRDSLSMDKEISSVSDSFSMNETTSREPYTSKDDEHRLSPSRIGNRSRPVSNRKPSMASEESNLNSFSSYGAEFKEIVDPETTITKPLHSGVSEVTAELIYPQSIISSQWSRYASEENEELFFSCVDVLDTVDLRTNQKDSSNEILAISSTLAENEAQITPDKFYYSCIVDKSSNNLDEIAEQLSSENSSFSNQETNDDVISVSNEEETKDSSPQQQQPSEMKVEESKLHDTVSYSYSERSIFGEGLDYINPEKILNRKDNQTNNDKKRSSISSLPKKITKQESGNKLNERSKQGSVVDEKLRSKQGVGTKDIDIASSTAEEEVGKSNYIENDDAKFPIETEEILRKDDSSEKSGSGVMGRVKNVFVQESDSTIDSSITGNFASSKTTFTPTAAADFNKGKAHEDLSQRNEKIDRNDEVTTISEHEEDISSISKSSDRRPSGFASRLWSKLRNSLREEHDESLPETTSESDEDTNNETSKTSHEIEHNDTSDSSKISNPILDTESSAPSEKIPLSIDSSTQITTSDDAISKTAHETKSSDIEILYAGNKSNKSPDSSVASNNAAETNIGNSSEFSSHVENTESKETQESTENSQLLSYDNHSYNSSSLQKAQSKRSSDTQSDSLTETHSDSLTESPSESLPETYSGDVPEQYMEAFHDAVSESQSDNISETIHEMMPKTSTEVVPNEEHVNHFEKNISPNPSFEDLHQDSSSSSISNHETKEESTSSSGGVSNAMSYSDQFFLKKNDAPVSLDKLYSNDSSKLSSEMSLTDSVKHALFQEYETMIDLDLNDSNLVDSHNSNEDSSKNIEANTDKIDNDANVDELELGTSESFRSALINEYVETINRDVTDSFRETVSSNFIELQDFTSKNNYPPPSSQSTEISEKPYFPTETLEKPLKYTSDVDIISESDEAHDPSSEKIVSEVSSSAPNTTENKDLYYNNTKQTNESVISVNLEALYERSLTKQDSQSSVADSFKNALFHEYDEMINSNVGSKSNVIGMEEVLEDEQTETEIEKNCQVPEEVINKSLFVQHNRTNLFDETDSRSSVIESVEGEDEDGFESDQFSDESLEEIPIDSSFECLGISRHDSEEDSEEMFISRNVVDYHHTRQAGNNYSQNKYEPEYYEEETENEHQDVYYYDIGLPTIFEHGESEEESSVEDLEQSPNYGTAKHMVQNHQNVHHSFRNSYSSRTTVKIFERNEKTEKLENERIERDFDGIAKTLSEVSLLDLFTEAFDEIELYRKPPPLSEAQKSEREELKSVEREFIIIAGNLFTSAIVDFAAESFDEIDLTSKFMQFQPMSTNKSERAIKNSVYNVEIKSPNEIFDKENIFRHEKENNEFVSDTKDDEPISSISSFQTANNNVEETNTTSDDVVCSDDLYSNASTEECIVNEKMLDFDNASNNESKKVPCFERALANETENSSYQDSNEVELIEDCDSSVLQHQHFTPIENMNEGPKNDTEIQEQKQLRVEMIALMLTAAAVSPSLFGLSSQKSDENVPLNDENEDASCQVQIFDALDEEEIQSQLVDDNDTKDILAPSSLEPEISKRDDPSECRSDEQYLVPNSMSIEIVEDIGDTNANTEIPAYPAENDFANDSFVTTSSLESSSHETECELEATSKASDESDLILRQNPDSSLNFDNNNEKDEENKKEIEYLIDAVDAISVERGEEQQVDDDSCESKSEHFDDFSSSSENVLEPLVYPATQKEELSEENTSNIFGHELSVNKLMSHVSIENEPLEKETPIDVDPVEVIAAAIVTAEVLDNDTELDESKEHVPNEASDHIVDEITDYEDDESFEHVLDETNDCEIDEANGPIQYEINEHELENINENDRDKTDEYFMADDHDESEQLSVCSNGSAFEDVASHEEVNNPDNNNDDYQANVDRNTNYYQNRITVIQMNDVNATDTGGEYNGNFDDEVVRSVSEDSVSDGADDDNDNNSDWEESSEESLEDFWNTSGSHPSSSGSDESMDSSQSDDSEIILPAVNAASLYLFRRWSRVSKQIPLSKRFVGLSSDSSYTSLISSRFERRRFTVECNERLETEAYDVAALVVYDYEDSWKKPLKMLQQSVVQGGMFILFLMELSSNEAAIGNYGFSSKRWGEPVKIYEEDDVLVLSIPKYKCLANITACSWKYSLSSTNISLKHEYEILEQVTISSPACEYRDPSYTLPSEKINKAVKALQSHGFCILRNLFSKERVCSFGDAAVADVKEATLLLTEKYNINFDPTSKLTPFNFRELSMDERLRINIHDGQKLRNCMNLVGSDWITKSQTIVDILFKAMNPCSTNVSVDDAKNSSLVGNDIKKQNSTLVTSNQLSGQEKPKPPISTQVSVNVTFPDCSDQGIHSSTAHLFEDVDSIPPHSLKLYLPASSHNVPERDGSNPVGVAAFIAGSHIPTKKYEYDKNKDLKYMNIVRPSIVAGDAILFDCRILHFGLANTSDNELGPIIYQTWMQEWFSSTTDVEIPSRDMNSLFTNLNNYS